MHILRSFFICPNCFLLVHIMYSGPNYLKPVQIGFIIYTIGELKQFYKLKFRNSWFTYLLNSNWMCRTYVIILFIWVKFKSQNWKIAIYFSCTDVHMYIPHNAKLWVEICVSLSKSIYSVLLNRQQFAVS